MVIKIIQTIAEMQHYSNIARNNRETLAFVPTMGFFHKGHLKLMKTAKPLCSRLVVSLFVNPTQFGPGEDLDSYPTNHERDIKLAGEVGVDVLFMPDKKDLYPEGYETYVSLENLPHHLCGLSRPVHFRGVATIVTKLFNIVKPHTAVFGQKDFQQLAIIRKMVKDLNHDIQIVGVPTVREKDNLAMSSRNAYLKQADRKTACCLYESMELVKRMKQEGETNAGALKKAAVSLIQSRPNTEIDYISICHPDTLEELDIIDGPCLFALAVKVGKPRLIDNVILE